MAVQVTFMIGNGFDLNLGLETKYEHFYPHYVGGDRFATNDPEILQFKELLQRSENYSRWADFELALGQHTTEPPLNHEASLRKCLQDFKRCFAQYLQEEEERVCFNECGRDMALKFVKNLRNHLDYLEPRFFNIVQKAHPLKDFRVYSILNFNYTTVIDRLFDFLNPNDFNPSARGPVIHVHGTHSTGMIMGVDNIGQVANPELFTDTRHQRTFVKPLLNQQSGYGHDGDALACLETSDIVCIFGMSLGETDQIWWERLGQWLPSAPYRHLLIFSRGKHLDPLFPEDILDYQDDIRDLFLSRAGILSEHRASFRDSIHIVITSEFFALDPIIAPSAIGNPSPGVLIPV